MRKKILFYRFCMWIKSDTHMWIILLCRNVVYIINQNIHLSSYRALILRYTPKVRITEAYGYIITKHDRIYKEKFDKFRHCIAIKNARKNFFDKQKKPPQRESFPHGNQGANFIAVLLRAATPYTPQTAALSSISPPFPCISLSFPHNIRSLPSLSSPKYI